MEREKVREQEPRQQESGEHYENTLQLNAAARERARTGKIVIKAKERPWRQSRQAYTKTFLHWHGIEDTAATDWICFIHDVKRHSGNTAIRVVSSCLSWKVKAIRKWTGTRSSGKSGI